MSDFAQPVDETGPLGGYVAVGSGDYPDAIDDDTGTYITVAGNQSGTYTRRVDLSSPPSADGVRVYFPTLDNVDDVTVSAVVDGNEEVCITGITDSDEGTWIEGTCTPGLLTEIVVTATTGSSGYVYLAEAQPHELLMPRHGH